MIILALVHYSIFFVSYTTIFTWGFGALSGMVGGLAYWLAQQGVQRGNQPFYYYGLLGLLYEYLPLLFSLIGGGVAVWLKLGPAKTADSPEGPASRQNTAFPLFLTGWTILSWISYTWAGEKMPWLFVHIALPSILLSAWVLGLLLEKMQWVKVNK